MKNNIELSIVMPCLNESQTIAGCIKQAQAFLRKHKVEGEIIVGDNGSTDGSQEIAEKLGARVVAVPIRGYGAALYAATKAAKGKYIIMGDSDASYDFSRLKEMLEKLREGYDLVMGNRFKGGIKSGAMPWKNRYIGNPVLSAIGRLFFSIPVGDFHCGIRGFSKKAFDRMGLVTQGMEFASEMVIKACLGGMRVTEVPVTLSPDGRDRPPHLRPWRDGWRHLRFMLLYSPRWLFLYPGLALTIGGLSVLIWLATGPKPIGNVVLDIHTMVYASFAAIIGFNTVIFAVFSRLYAMKYGLMPHKPTVERLSQGMRLEFWLLVGVIIMCIGLGISVHVFSGWERDGFRELDPRSSMRLVIPAALIIALGIQTMLSSFFVGTLLLKVNETEDKKTN